MVNDSLVRFAILMSDNESHNFYNIVSKLIQLNLYLKKDFLTIPEIASDIKERFGIEFSESELSRAVTEKQKNYVESKKNGHTAYYLNDETIERIGAKEKQAAFEEIVEEFLRANTDEIKFILGERNYKKFIKDSIIKFFYEAFDSNVRDLNRLVSNKEVDFPNPDQLSGEDKRISYLFLKWKNEKKDRFVYNLINSSYEYCVLTLKDNKTPIKQTIESKVFLIDTNVMLSLIGVNGKFKQIATQNFLKKCREFNISIQCTNFSKTEAIDTISSLVDKCRNYINNEEEPDNSYGNSLNEISNLYNLWMVETSSANTSYNNFKTHLSNKLTEVMYSFKIHEITDEFLKLNQDKINNYCEDLKEFKELHSNRKRTAKSIRHDVVNYINVLNLKSVGCSNLIDCKYYFITFDKILCLWANNKCNGAPCPLVDPNVMYSLLLRFSNRGEDDFRSFNEFLSVSVSYYYDDERAIATKAKIAKIIKNNTSYSEEEKTKILVTANNIIDNKVWNEEEIDEQEVLEDSCLSIAQDIEKEKNEEIKAINLKHKEQLENERQHSYGKGFCEGQQEALEQLANHQTDIAIIARRLIYIAIGAILILSICLLVVTIIKFKSNKSIFEEVWFYVSAAGIFGPVIIYIIRSIMFKTLNFKVAFWEINRDEIFNKKLKKLKLKVKKDNKIN